MKLRWSHAVVYVRDLDAMLDFYTGVLGFEVTDRGPINANNPGLELVFMSQVEADHHQLAFAPVRAGDEPSNTVHHFAFRVESLDDVKDMYATLRRDGRATELKPINHGNAWSIYFKDPEENGLEVFCDSPWHVRQPQGEPWDPAADEKEMREITKKDFGAEPEFGPIDEFYAERARRLRRR